MSKQKIAIGIVAILIILVFFSVYSNKGAVSESKRTFIGQDVSSAENITCTYPQTLYASYAEQEISQSLSTPEKQPLIFTFSAFTDSESGKLSYLDSTKTITSVPVIKLIDNDEKMVYIDGSGENYLTIHTIYKKLGVSTYAKNVSIFGIPTATLAMGTCTGY